MNGSLNFCTTPVYNGAYSVGYNLIQPLFHFLPTSVSLLNSSFVELEAIDGGRTAVGSRKACIFHLLINLSNYIVDKVRY